MPDPADKPISDNDALVERAKAVLAEQRRTIQRTFAALAEAQAAINVLERRRFGRTLAV